MTPSHAPVETLIIGAGPSGLAVAACLAQRERPFAIVDAAAAVASTWRRHYRRLHLHTARHHSGLPGMPMPEDYPTFPSRQQVVDYLDAYAARFGIAPRLNTRVTRARRVDGAWLVDVDEGQGYRAEHLVVATGYNRVPFTPAFEGLDGFAGEVVHTAHYGDGARFAGQDVLVVGVGNSGAEIAIDLWEHGARPQIVIRNPIHVVPREILGFPAQDNVVRLSRLPPRVVDRVTLPIIRRLIGDLSAWGIRRPERGPLEQIATEGRVPLIDVGTVDLIKQGAVKVRPALERVEGPDTCVFADGARARFDAIVMATGYEARLDDFLEPADSVTDARGYPTVHGRETFVPGLFFCGFRNPHTGAIRESAIEGERIARAIASEPAGRRTLRDGTRRLWRRLAHG